MLLTCQRCVDKQHLSSTGCCWGGGTLIARSSLGLAALSAHVPLIGGKCRSEFGANRAKIKSIGVPFCHPMAKGISIGRSFCHILCHIAILRAKCAQDSQKDSYSHPLCQRRGPIERRATASLERASSELFWLPYHRPSVRGLRTIQGHHLYWKVLCESSERYGPSEGGEQLDLHI